MAAGSKNLTLCIFLYILFIYMWTVLRGGKPYHFLHFYDWIYELYIKFLPIQIHKGSYYTLDLEVKVTKL